MTLPYSITFLKDPLSCICNLVKSSENRDDFMLFFPNFHAADFSLIVILASTFSMILNTSGDNEHHCIFLTFLGISLVFCCEV